MFSAGKTNVLQKKFNGTVQSWHVLDTSFLSASSKDPKNSIAKSFINFKFLKGKPKRITFSKIALVGIKQVIPFKSKVSVGHSLRLPKTLR